MTNLKKYLCAMPAAAALVCTLTATAQKRLRYEDYIYEDAIRTVQVYQAGPATISFRPAAAPLLQQQLVLEFDDIHETVFNYIMRLYHCSFDWRPSDLSDPDFLRGFNEFPINQFRFSNDTHLPYVHYTASIPPVKLPGNYLLVVYRDGNPGEPVISRRILIYENRISVNALNNFAGAGTLRENRQLLNLLVNYGNLDVINPPDMIRVVVRQNQRWDNALFNPAPTFVRDNRNEIEYRVFDDVNSFPAGNEFRLVDVRSLLAPGQNVQRINRSVKPHELYVMTDGSRQGQAYAEYRDLNGQYFIDNLDFPEPVLSGNYLFVNFFLQSPRLPNDLYVMGHYNLFCRTAENKMAYNRSRGGYEARVALKQGFYSYAYVLDGDNPNQIEGDHFQTENSYEALVYFRSLKPFADLLLGYTTWTINPR
jgi:hypothetical protein